MVLVLSDFVGMLVAQYLSRVLCLAISMLQKPCSPWQADMLQGVKPPLLKAVLGAGSLASVVGDVVLVWGLRGDQHHPCCRYRGDDIVFVLYNMSCPIG